MKGKYGAPMNAVEYRYKGKKRGNRKCSLCKHLYFGVVGKESCYKCEVTRKKRYYTSVCFCKDYQPKETQ